MKIVDYNLICWQMNENAVYGQLIGFGQQVVADDIRSLKGMFTEYIEKKFQKSEFSEPSIQHVKMKNVELQLRPHYQEGDRIYPMKDSIDIKVQAVFGESIYGSEAQGYYECILPSLNKSFYFYKVEDLPKLVEHFSRDVFHRLTPREIYNLLLPKQPWLETLSIKIPKAKKSKRGRDSYAIDYNEYPNLSAIAQRLPQKRKEVRKGLPDTAWERGQLVDQLERILVEEKGNVLLVGKTGVGKSAIINETVKVVHNRDKNREEYERRTFWRTSPGRVTARARYLGEWQMICEELIDNLQYARGILWIDNFVRLAMTGGEGPEDSMAAFLMPFIREGKLQMMSEVTQEQLEVMRRLLPGFVDYFRILKVEEMDTETTLKIFDYFSNHTQKYLNVSFTRKALETSYVLLDRFVRYESFPGKAVRFLGSCANKANLEQQTEVTDLDVVATFTAQSGIPDFLLRDDVTLDDDELKLFFLDKIKGQDHVIDRIASIIKVFKAGLNDPNKPVATMIFAGPTGVGKTATVKAIADYFFGMGQGYRPLIRLDMSEFQHPSQIYRLIGTNGKLIQSVRERPFCVLLLDEIEKANPLIFDALLTVLDEGLLIDDSGRLTDFRNTIIIMTSNLGASQRSSLGFRSYQDQDYDSAIRSFFRPEFYNRVDMSLIFNPLDEETILSITQLELSLIEKRDGIRQRNLKIKFTEALIALVADKGFDKKYGARPLQREVERLVISPIARLLIKESDLKDKTLTIDFDGEVKVKVS